MQRTASIEISFWKLDYPQFSVYILLQIRCNVNINIVFFIVSAGVAKKILDNLPKSSFRCLKPIIDKIPNRFSFRMLPPFRKQQQQCRIFYRLKQCNVSLGTMHGSSLQYE